MAKYVCPSNNPDHRLVFITTDPSAENVILVDDPAYEFVCISGDPYCDHIYIVNHQEIYNFSDFFMRNRISRKSGDNLTNETAVLSRLNLSPAVCSQKFLQGRRVY